MPEARDRLSRQEDNLVSAYSLRRISRIGERNAGRNGSIAFILEDESEEGPVVLTPLRWRSRAMVATPGSMGVTPRRGGATRYSRTGRIPQVIGCENQTISGSGRGNGTALPAWYPRRPLNDITAVMKAIERRRERRRSSEGLGMESPTLQDMIFHGPLSTPGAQLGHNNSMIFPFPANSNWHCPPSIGKVPKILLNITHQNGGDSACLTPQKKLLNNIDTVEKVVMEELRKLKRTPSAKKAEREKRVRTLMSMR